MFVLTEFAQQHSGVPAWDSVRFWQRIWMSVCLEHCDSVWGGEKKEGNKNNNVLEGGKAWKKAYF